MNHLLNGGPFSTINDQDDHNNPSYTPIALLLYNKTNQEDGSLELLTEIESITELDVLRYLCQIFVVEKEYTLDHFFCLHKKVRKFCEHMAQYISLKNFDQHVVHHYTDEHFLNDWARDNSLIDKAMRQRKFKRDKAGLLENSQFTVTTNTNGGTTTVSAVISDQQQQPQDESGGGSASDHNHVEQQKEISSIHKVVTNVVTAMNNQKKHHTSRELIREQLAYAIEDQEIETQMRRNAVRMTKSVTGLMIKLYTQVKSFRHKKNHLNPPLQPIVQRNNRTSLLSGIQPIQKYFFSCFFLLTLLDLLLW